MSSLVDKVKDKLNLGKSSDTTSSHTQTTGSKHGNVTRKHQSSSPLRPLIYMNFAKCQCAMVL